MCSNNAGLVDVRFFGAHDKAWVSYKDCYLYSLKDPNSYKQKRYDIDQCTKVTVFQLWIEILCWLLHDLSNFCDLRCSERNMYFNTQFVINFI